MSANSRSRRKFIKEFKAEAVAMVAASGGNVAKVARELNIYDSTLGNWVRVRGNKGPTRGYRTSIEATIEWGFTNGIAESNNASIGRI